MILLDATLMAGSSFAAGYWLSRHRNGYELAVGLFCAFAVVVQMIARFA